MTQTSFPKKEEQILAFWQEKKIFEKTLAKRSPEATDFVFYDGPPFATGLPHYGHIIAGTIKDVIPRYKTMQGFRVQRRWGWDCHGLPIENLIEQEKGFETKKDIEADIAGFNKACRDSVLRYRDEWKKSVDRTGRWVDMERDYKTMDNRYIEVIWWIFKELWRDGLIYEGYKSMHLCPRCETTLSNFEVTLGYKEVKDLGVTVRFRITNYELLITNYKLRIPNDAKVYMLAWTTTAWTLPGNMALAVGEDVDYVVAKVGSEAEFTEVGGSVVKNEFIIIAKDILQKKHVKDDIYHFGDKVVALDITGQLKGQDLVGLSYEPIFDFSREQIKSDPNFQNAFKVYAADFVSTEEGTGIVHIAPAFGDDDYQLSLKEHLPFLQHVNYDGTFKDYVSFAPGKKVKSKEDPTGADVEVIKYLAAPSRELKFTSAKYAHSYPHCWRCDTPLINYAASSWFVKVTALKERLLEANAKINWVPEHIRDGRFGKWLEGARDWAISRSRYWGAPLPVWRCESCKDIKVIGSVAELKQNKTPENSEVLSGSAKDLSFAGTQKSRQLINTIEYSSSSVKVDLHRPYIDGIVLSCDKCGGEMRRIKEVFDCWFESGAMPYASELIFSDYKITPQTARDELRKHIAFPADFIAEGTDQTRGWFYTLMVLGVALYGESPFKNVIVNGIILAEDGQKMSKRLKNYPDPQVVMDKYGADAMRFYLMSSPAVRAEALNFSEKGVDEVYKKVILLTLNVAQFWKTFFEPSAHGDKKFDIIDDYDTLHKLDKWILLDVQLLIYDSTKYLDKYNIEVVCRSILDFINDLSVKYVRCSRHLFKNKETQNVVVLVLRDVLQTLAKLLAPITPFLAEYVYREIGGNKESVHFEKWPEPNHEFWQKAVAEEIGEIIDGFVFLVFEFGHNLRDRAGIKVRQPLSELNILQGALGVTNFNTIDLEGEYGELIKKELNVNTIKVVDELPTGESWISIGDVALNIKIDNKLREEGILRELTRQINNLRKKQGLTINDRVIVEYSTESSLLSQIIEKYQEQLKHAVLASDAMKGESDLENAVLIDGEKITITLLCQK